MIRVLQCWDDGIEDDIRLCALLRKHQAIASFNLNPGLHGKSRSEPWMYQGVKPVRRLALAELVSVYEGFTIANHTVSHPWPLEISLEEWRREVIDGRKMLQDLFAQPISGFVYPFGQRSEETDQVVREAGHRYARGSGASCKNEPRSFPPKDALRFVPDCHFLDPDLLKKFADAKASGAAVFYFWGHSYEMISEADWERMEQILETISADPEAQWEELPNLFS